MRVSTLNMAMGSLTSMLEAQSKLNRTQLKISNGREILAPADNPYGSARALDLREATSIYDQYRVNADFGRNRLGLEESVLQNVTDALHRLRELAIQGNNDTQTNESRSFIGAEVNLILEQLMSLSNTTDSNNEYLFAGYQGTTLPFTSDGFGTFFYNGDDGNRAVKVGSETDIQVGDSGKEVFLEVRNGNGRFWTYEAAGNTGNGVIDPGTVNGLFVPDTYTVTITPGPLPTDPPEYSIVDSGGTPLATNVPWVDKAPLAGLAARGIETSIHGQPAPGDVFTIAPSQHKSIFSVVYDLGQSLTTATVTDAEKAHFHNEMARAIGDIDQSLGNILKIRARIGARLNTVDKQIDMNEAFTLQMKTTLSEIEDLDYAKATTDLNLQLVGLEAAQIAYNRIQNLSMFNYIN